MHLTKKGDITILLGAKIGEGTESEVVGQSAYGEKNERRDRLVQFAIEH